jgi:hypothetical protein
MLEGISAAQNITHQPRPGVLEENRDIRNLSAFSSGLSVDFSRNTLLVPQRG